MVWFTLFDEFEKKLKKKEGLINYCLAKHLADSPG